MTGGACVLACYCVRVSATVNKTVEGAGACVCVCVCVYIRIYISWCGFFVLATDLLETLITINIFESVNFL
jgi:hypothetical protein